MNIGDKVIFTGDLKFLPNGCIGVIGAVCPTWATIYYPQHQSFQEDGNGGWKPIKGIPNAVFAHSAKLSEIILADNQ